MFLKKEARPRFLKSIRTKLALGYALFLCLSVVLVAGLFYIKVEHNFQQAGELFLEGELHEMLNLLAEGVYDTQMLANVLSKRTLFSRASYTIYYAVFDAEGYVLARSEAYREDAGPIQTFLKEKEKTGTGISFIRTYREDAHREKLVAYTSPFVNRAGDRYFLQLAMNLSSLRKILDPLRMTMFWSIPLVMLLGFAGGLWLTIRALSPIQKLTRAAQRLSLHESEQLLPLSGTGDELDRLAGTFNDVFSRLRDAYQRIVHFTADASHELRLPITAIKGEAEVVLERERSLEEYRKVLASVIEEFDRLTAMIQRLLALARADSGSDRLEKEHVDMRELFSDLTDFYSPLAEEKDIALRVDVNEPVTVEGDKTRLHELFANLLENAIKFTPRGGRVTLGAHYEGEYGVCMVADTGIGIPEDELPRIFERFYRVDKSRSRSQGGAGLGLSIAESIAKAHGSYINVESCVGQGSIFKVLLSRISQSR